MTETQVRNGLVSIDSLLIPIEGDNPSGISLRYERVYDEIREARREDDDTISYGIWQHELKRSDWGRVESLCSDALQNHSKDLQIVGWLAESWVMIDRIEGLARALNLLEQLTDKFWDTIYPKIPAGDLDYRSQFYDWFDKTLSARLVKLIFIPNELGEGVTLADWLAAQRLDAILKRAPDADKLARKAEERGQIRFEQCHTILSRVTIDYGDAYLRSLSSANSALNNLKNILDHKFPDNTLAFEALTGNLNEMIRIYKMEMSTRPRDNNEDNNISDDPLITPNQSDGAGTEESLPRQTMVEVSPVGEIGEPAASAGAAPILMPVHTRELAYQQLSEIATLLESLEPHSPASQILRRVVSWQNKSLMDIFNEIGSSPEDLVALMRFLGIGINKPPQPIS